MVRSITRMAVVIGLAAVMLSANCWAWGPQAKKTITLMAMQMARDEYPKIFPAGDSDFKAAILLGAKLGEEALKERMPMSSDDDILHVIDTEMQLLRDVSHYSINEYYGVRLGILASMASDVIQPYGFAWNANEIQLQRKLNREIDTHLGDYTYITSRRQPHFIQGLKDYFKAPRQFYSEDKRIIAEEYDGGAGYAGLLGSGGAEIYFSRAIDVVADIWFTVLRTERGDYERPASPRLLKWYFVDEMGYLLSQNNVAGTEEVYMSFASVRFDLPEMYEALGDLYYASLMPGTQERAVQEWHKSYRMAKLERGRIGGKLVQHYIGEAKRQLLLYEEPGEKGRCLDAALQALESALRIDNRNEEIGKLVKAAKAEQKVLADHLLVITNFIAEGQGLEREGDTAKNNGDESVAIKNYRGGMARYRLVDDVFLDQERIAKNAILDLDQKITDVLNAIIDRAAMAIEDGDTAKGSKAKKFDEALAHYKSVKQILSAVPDDVSENILKSKRELQASMHQKISVTEQEQIDHKKRLAQIEADKKAARGSTSTIGGSNRRDR
jgi:hypothetical protein